MSEDIKILRGSKSFGDEDNGAIVFVESAPSLIEALSHGGTIVINAPEIILSDGFPTSTEALSWERVFDGREPILSNVSNMRLTGEGASLLIEPRYGYVLTFRNCHNLLVKNISIGHVDEGFCTGGVLRFEGCTNIRIEDCDLFGCGTYGVELLRSSSVEIARCKIRDCSYGIARIQECSDIIFSSCEFRNNQEFDLISFLGSNEKYCSENAYSQTTGPQNFTQRTVDAASFFSAKVRQDEQPFGTVRSPTIKSITFPMSPD